VIEVQCPKCGHAMDPHADRDVHHERIVELSCPQCEHREVVVVSARPDVGR
jgi:DNA-directed RNA polymerase subunit RPC12/RpoP